MTPLHVPVYEEIPESCRRYYLANLPRDTWTPKRQDTCVTSTNREAYELVLKYIDERVGFTGNGRGITLFGPRKSGKTYLLSVILRSMLAQDETLLLSEENSDLLRIDYQELSALSYRNREREEHPLFSNLKFARVIFLDNIYLTQPTPMILHCLEHRRDQRRTTFMAFRMNSIEQTESVYELYEIFSDINWKSALAGSFEPRFP